MLNETFPVIFKHLASMIENETVLDKHPILVDCVEILCSLWKTIDFWMSQNIFKFPDIAAADLLKLLMIGTKGPQLLLTVYDYDCGMNNERTNASTEGGIDRNSDFLSRFLLSRQSRSSSFKAACTHACCKRPRQQQFSNINNKMKMKQTLFLYYFVIWKKSQFYICEFYRISTFRSKISQNCQFNFSSKILIFGTKIQLLQTF